MDNRKKLTVEELDQICLNFRNNIYPNNLRQYSLSIRDVARESKELRLIINSIINRSYSKRDMIERAITAGIILGATIMENRSNG